MYSYAASATVTIYVGPMQKKYIVHEDLICAHSSYFRSCFREGAFAEGLAKACYLSDKHETPEAMDLIFNAIYGTSPLEKISSAPLSSAVLDAYVMADKLGMERFSNELVDSIRAAIHRNEPGVEDIVSIQQITSLCEAGLGESPLPQYLSRWIAYSIIHDPGKWHKDGITTDDRRQLLTDISGNQQLAQGLFDDLIYDMDYLGSTHDPSATSGCVFHDHSQGSTCTGPKL